MNYNDVYNDNALAAQINNENVDNYLLREFQPNRIFDAATQGALNRLSPTQNMRWLWEPNKDNYIYVNNGIVPDSVMQEHPVGGILANAATDGFLLSNGWRRNLVPKRFMENARLNYAAANPQLKVTSAGVVEVQPNQVTNLTIGTNEMTGRGVAPRGSNVIGGKNTGAIRGGRRVIVPRTTGSPGYSGSTVKRFRTETVDTRIPAPYADESYFPILPMNPSTGATLGSPVPYKPGVTPTYKGWRWQTINDDPFYNWYKKQPEGTIQYYNGEPYSIDRSGANYNIIKTYTNGEPPKNNGDSRYGYNVPDSTIVRDTYRVWGTEPTMKPQRIKLRGRVNPSATINYDDKIRVR